MLLPCPLEGIVEVHPDTQVARRMTARRGIITYLVLMLLHLASHLSLIPVSIFGFAAVCSLIDRLAKKPLCGNLTM